MKTIFYGIYLFGAIMAALCATYLDPATAAITLVLFPVALLELLIMSGRVKFNEVDLDEEEHDTPLFREKFPTLAAVEDNDMTDTEALDKYGMQIINEMDLMITEKEAQLNYSRNIRDEFYDRIRGVKK